MDAFSANLATSHSEPSFPLTSGQETFRQACAVRNEDSRDEIANDVKRRDPGNEVAFQLCESRSFKRVAGNRRRKSAGIRWISKDLLKYNTEKEAKPTQRRDKLIVGCTIFRLASTSLLVENAKIT